MVTSEQQSGLRDVIRIPDRARRVHVEEGKARRPTGVPLQDGRRNAAIIDVGASGDGRYAVHVSRALPNAKRACPKLAPGSEER